MILNPVTYIIELIRLPKNLTYQINQNFTKKIHIKYIFKEK